MHILHIVAGRCQSLPTGEQPPSGIFGGIFGSDANAINMSNSVHIAVAYTLI